MLLNQTHVCFMCRCRSDNLAVGKPDKLAWFCLYCGQDRAKEAYEMKVFDRLEQEALKKVAAQLPADNFNFPKEELPDFLTWVLQEFGNQIRAQIDGQDIPFDR